jgi:phosphoribosylanthranilate isomerase
VTTQVKVCGLKTLAEARCARDAGADLLGFIFWAPGKRYVAPERAAQILRDLRAEDSPRPWAAVGVFVDPDPAEVAEVTERCHFDFVQLSGNESAELVAAMPRPTIKAVHVRPGAEQVAVDVVRQDALGAARYLLDTHADGMPGGTGVTFDWAALQTVVSSCLVAGGLRPDNVSTALSTLRPFGVDVSTGVEYRQGGKDPLLVRSFVEAVRTYDHRSR